MSGLLHIISANLGGDLVVWAKADVESGLLTIVDIADPGAPTQVISDLIQQSSAIAPTTLSTHVIDSDEPLLIPLVDGADCSADSLPEPWAGYLAADPIHGLIAVPIRLDEAATGVLFAGRRTTAVQYNVDDLRFVESGAYRLAGRRPNASIAEDHGSAARGVVGWLAGQRRRIGLRQIVLGAGLPLLLTLVLRPLGDAANYRPGVLLLLGVVVAAVVAGARAAALSGVVGSLALWWALTPKLSSWSLASNADVVGVALFLVVAGGVVLLEHRLERMRESERLERQLSETLLAQSPSAIAVFDEQLRYQRVNQPMAEMNGVTAAQHVGLRPGDLSPIAGQLHEHLLQRVRDSGQPITDHELTIVMREIGVERHWKVNYQPLRDGRSDGGRDRCGSDRHDVRRRVVAAGRAIAATVGVPHDGTRRTADRRVRLLVPGRHVSRASDRCPARPQRARRRRARRVRRHRRRPLARRTHHDRRGRPDCRGRAHEHAGRAAGTRRRRSPSAEHRPSAPRGTGPGQPVDAATRRRHRVRGRGDACRLGRAAPDHRGDDDAGRHGVVAGHAGTRPDRGHRRCPRGRVPTRARRDARRRRGRPGRPRRRW